MELLTLDGGYVDRRGWGGMQRQSNGTRHPFRVRRRRRGWYRDITPRRHPQWTKVAWLKRTVSTWGSSEPRVAYIDVDDGLRPKHRRQTLPLHARRAQWKELFNQGAELYLWSTAGVASLEAPHKSSESTTASVPSYPSHT